MLSPMPTAKCELTLPGTVIGFKTITQAHHEDLAVALRIRQLPIPQNMNFPVVEFDAPRNSPRTSNDIALIPYMAIELLNAEGTVEEKRRQVPLILSYASSVHKSQGQSHNLLKVDLSRSFAAGTSLDNVATDRHRTGLRRNLKSDPARRPRASQFRPQQVSPRPRAQVSRSGPSAESPGCLSTQMWRSG